MAIASPPPPRSELYDDDGLDVLPLWVLGALPHSESGPCALTRSLREERLSLTLRASSGAGLPTGRYARLLLAHLWAEAVRGETPEILLAHSWYHLCALLDIHNTGGANGTCHQIRKQLRRLADLSLEVRRHAGSVRIPPGPESSTLLASFPLATASDLPVDGKRSNRGLAVRLSTEFFAHLRQSTPPFDLSRLHELQGPLRIDLYS